MKKTLGKPRKNFVPTFYRFQSKFRSFSEKLRYFRKIPKKNSEEF